MRTRERIGALILAAGFSSRMGAFKPLLPIGSATVLEEAITRFQEAGIAAVKVVVGYEAERIIPILERAGIEWVLNDQYERGMLSSVLVGVRVLDPELEAFFLLPADTPLVKPRTIATVLEAYRSGEARVVYPCFRGVRGHPPLLSRACIPSDLVSDYPGGLRAYLSQHEQSAREIEVPDQAILMGCNTASDYARLQRYALREAIPTEQECQVFQHHHRVPEKVAAHSRVVAQLARLLGVLLNRAGLQLDLDLIVAGGLLHDLAKGQPDHARKAARLLVEAGCPAVARVVASHMDLAYREGTVDEAALVYLADKLVAGDELVALEQRFAKGLARYADRPEILKAVLNRRDTARRIQREVEAALGELLEQILHQFARNIRAVSGGGERHIYLVRHGAVPREEAGRRFLGQLDVPLSGEGIDQVRRLHEELSSVPFSAVFCSDLKRSVETAAILTEDRPDLVAVPRPELREIDLGEWDGLSFEAVQTAFPDEFQKRGWDIVHYQPPGGESFLDCTRRVIPTFYQLLHTTRGNILVVGHAGVNRIILCQVLGRSLTDLLDIRQDYACVNLIQYDDGAFTAKVLNGEMVQ